MNQQPVRDVRTMTDAEVFAALCALPEGFRFEVGRIAIPEPDPDLLAALPAPTPFLNEQLARKAHEEAISASVRPRQHWTLLLTNQSPHSNGPAFYARAPTLAEAWLQVREQIAAFVEVL